MTILTNDELKTWDLYAASAVLTAYKQEVATRGRIEAAVITAEEIAVAAAEIADALFNERNKRGLASIL